MKSGQRFADGDHIIIDTARGEEFGICVGGQKMKTYSVEPRYGGTSTAKWESCTLVRIRTDLSWYSSSGEYPQLNVSGEEYVWVNIG